MLLAEYTVDKTQTTTSTCFHAVRCFSLELPVNAHVTFDRFAVDHLRNMVSAGVNTFFAANTLVGINNGDAHKVHVHGSCRTNTDARKVFAGSTVDKFINTFVEGAHCNATMLFPAGCNTNGTTPTRVSVLFYMHCHGIFLFKDNCFLWFV